MSNAMNVILNGIKDIQSIIDLNLAQSLLKEIDSEKFFDNVLH